LHGHTHFQNLHLLSSILYTACSSSLDDVLLISHVSHTLTRAQLSRSCFFHCFGSCHGDEVTPLVMKRAEERGVRHACCRYSKQFQPLCLRVCSCLFVIGTACVIGSRIFSSFGSVASSLFCFRGELIPAPMRQVKTVYPRYCSVSRSMNTIFLKLSY